MREFLSAVAMLIVIDGDAVHTTDGRKFRLLGYDTPETYFARCDREKALGEAATARLRELLQQGPVSLQPTGASCRYKRECAHLSIGGEDVADIMIREGLAVPYTGRGRRHDWCR